MTAARTLGISLKRFEGWEPTPGEVEWDDLQQAWMLALAEFEDGLCPLCRMPKRICSDPDGEGQWLVPAPTRCHVTTAMSIARASYLKQPQSEALLFTVQRKR